MSDDTHTPPLSWQSRKNQILAYWSKKPMGRALVLVHGFSGCPESTWRGLPQQLILQAEASGFDILSFGYDSVKQTAGESANQLHRFLDELVLTPSKVSNTTLESYDLLLKRTDDWRYKHLIVAGHSLGACVARRAFLNQIQSGKNKWDLQKKLVWFAPAHRGAKINLLLSAATSLIPGGIGESLNGGTKYFAPSLLDLEKGSEFLTELIEDTKLLCEVHTELNAPVTFWALKDKVVSNSQFAKDVTPFEEVDGEDHISICKITRFDNRLKGLLNEMRFT